MSETAFLNPDHDHDHCLEMAIERARTACEAKGIKFTSLRERVFRAVADSHTAIGAYDIIELLAQGGKRIAPISLYRILDTLSEAGLIHRLESKNSYFACHLAHKKNDKSDKRLIFLTCNQCDTVVEMESADIGKLIKNISETAGFQVNETSVEIAGSCKHCLEKQKATEDLKTEDSKKST